MRRLTSIFLLLFLFSSSIYAKTSTSKKNQNKISSINILPNDLLIEADKLYHGQNFSKAIDLYEQLESIESINKKQIIKKMALSHAALNHTKESVVYLEKYLKKDFKTSILDNEGFAPIKDSLPFKNIVNKYSLKITSWAFFYFYVALIGFFVVIILNFNKKMDFAARLLISAFIFIHSFFILHITIYITNFQYQIPHSYFMSTCFSFLYGPLMYFYFKRITLEYKFTKADLLHLIPTILFLIYLLPIYSLPANEKLTIMLQRASKDFSVNSNPIPVLVALKLTSLIIYGYYIRKLYLKSRVSKKISEKNIIWQRNIYTIHILYIFTYTIYGILISNNMYSGIIYHSQIFLMAIMVLYVGYSAYIQPSVFSGVYSSNNKLIFKYEKSGLTDSLSSELKNSVLFLFNQQKIYKEHDISLQIISNHLNTTRHNTSQVINEHFGMNFHELVNTYRIQEAKKILNTDFHKNLNIIDIAYEVGYNNKVTFNKAFKKDTKVTPSEYQRNILHP